MRAKQPPKQNNTNIWILPIILIIIVFFIEFFCDSFFFDGSVASIVAAQKIFKNMGFSVFNETGKENKTELFYNGNGLIINEESTVEEYINQSNLTCEEKFNCVNKLNVEIIFTEFFHALNTNWFFICLCIIAYNFMNIFKCFVLINTIFIANILSNTLAFIFHSPRPYMVYYQIKPVIMFNDWGSPNTQIVVLLSFLLTLYKVITEHQALKNKTAPRVILIVLFCLFGFVDIFVLFAAGTCSYNQLLVSIIIAIVTYQIIFILFEADVNKTKQLFNYIKIKLHYYLIINGLIIIFQYILYKFIIVDAEIEYYKRSIDIHQYRLPYWEMMYKWFNYREYFYLNEGNFCNVLCFLMNIVAFLSLKLEMSWTYKGNYEIWNKHNFEETKAMLSENTKMKNFEYSAYSEYVYIDGTQWNHTGFFKTLIRLLLMLILTSACFIPSFLLKDITGNNLFNPYLILMLLPLSLLTFGMFYFFKAIFRCLHLVK